MLTRWRKQASEGPRVFENSSSFKTGWWRLLKRAQITNLRWHDRRHHFASRLAQMSKSTHPLKLPNSVKSAAVELAKLDGVSLNQFIAAAVAEKVGTLRTASEFLEGTQGGAGGRQTQIAAAANY